MRITLLVLIGVALTACAPDSTETVVRKFVDAFNAKNVDAVMSIFGTAPEVYRRNYYYAGRKEVVAWAHEAIENYRDHIEIVQIKAKGNRATGVFHIVSAGTERFYLASDYLFTFQAEVIQGKLTCLNFGQLDPGICWEQRRENAEPD